MLKSLYKLFKNSSPIYCLQFFKCWIALQQRVHFPTKVHNNLFTAVFQLMDTKDSRRLHKSKNALINRVIYWMKIPEYESPWLRKIVEKKKAPNPKSLLGNKASHSSVNRSVCSNRVFHQVASEFFCSLSQF
ncbi:hypothetical protein CEXT_484241 [Caerostris extrusa]|uniref:Ycf1 n=1 Tax=Caerostris extrusa TaxID=172846 RepID=A0AAV4MGT7_CAEEX|nr:hypothetical protein CEXT_484241 [Caerostris extrusa]